jgi:hypothetical protein
LIGASTAFYFSWSKSNSCGAKVWRGITEEKRKRKKSALVLFYYSAQLSSFSILEGWRKINAKHFLQLTKISLRAKRWI